MLHHILYFWLTSDWKQKKVQNDFFKFCESKGIARIYWAPTVANEMKYYNY